MDLQCTRMIAPEVGALVEYGTNSDGTPCQLRVRGWLCPALPPSSPHECEIDALLFVNAPMFDGRRLRWCLRPEATHVSLAGGGTAVAPIGECLVRGMAPLSESELRRERRAAYERGSAGLLVGVLAR